MSEGEVACSHVIISLISLYILLIFYHVTKYIIHKLVNCFIYWNRTNVTFLSGRNRSCLINHC